MIGKLTGLIDSYGDDFVIIDVGGVGYVAFCSGRTLQALPPPGEAASLAIETYVREDQIKLFGFAMAAEREWFRILLNVQGVGTKVALALLSTFKVGDLASAIALKDVAAITRTPGVGKKLAERIVLDLKDKAPAFGSIDPAVMKLQGDIEGSRAPQPALDAISALVNLGYPQVQASAAVAGAMKVAGEAPKTEALIRLALKEMARS
jgi:holliday junction DNA helicase RuvA